MSIEARFQVQRKSFELDVDLRLPNQGITVLYGPSGSGKTTLLRCIAGLEKDIHGRLCINQNTWLDTEKGIDLPVYERPLGYIFQEASLFPHLTVQKNLDFGRKRTSTIRDPQRMPQIIELLGIGHLLNRKPHTLSGGERQRVAIARALAVCPEVLLMDEPLAALDANRKTEILSFLGNLRDEMDIPILYITHSPREVTQLADHLVFLKDGKVILDGPLASTLTHPDSPLSKGNRASSIITATVHNHDPHYDITETRFSGGSLYISGQDAPIGASVRMRIYARDITLSLQPPLDTTVQNILPATITDISPTEDGQSQIHLLLGDTPLLAHTTRKATDSLSLKPGQSVFAQFKATAVL